MATRTGKSASEPITRGITNVFADLGYADAEERQTKLRLALALNAIIDERRLSQADAAARLGINRNTLHKKLKEFGLENGPEPTA